ncbi:TetR/AcrR family transcriptional regulator [Aequorivita viscosa]|uniref:Transcriptional regulator, TetR family n=1 Tax=Aequorivita viscosa TaxID=797419 RepID=A0A1M6EAW9_9FLAO|nr:TetR/AcrR family transcriptional regulator [Aequorivita viscosa]SDW00702.1 transcriptional regulator, TetR family [Aequorivita viscosa]SHI82605.1 transcriptional regulator, TetR family [Aequorivita viscosa]
MVKEKANQDTETQILNAAKDVFQKKGMDGARMQEIANEAGINKAMLHYYYRSKQLLFEAVFNNAFSLLAPELNKILNDDSAVEDKVRNFTSNYITFISKHPYLPNFIIQELNRNPKFFEKIQQNAAFPTLDKFKAQVALEVEKGILKPIDGEQLFINIISLNIFPFIATPLIKGLLKVDDKGFKQLMEKRKIAVSEFIINSIKK